MIVKDGWFAKQRFLKPDVSEDISNNRSSLSKAPSLSIVFSILNIAKHCLHVWFASPYLLSHIPSCATCKPWATSLRRTTARYRTDCTVLHCTVLCCKVVFPVPMDLFSKLAQAVPGLPDTSGQYIIYLLLSIYTILYYQLLFAAATPDLNLSSAGRYDEWSCQLWKYLSYLSYLSSFLRFVPSVACEVL